MKRWVFSVLAAIALITTVSVHAGAADYIAPRQAIEKAADAAPQGVSGTFDILVHTTGVQEGDIFLNSENDYRDQRNVTVVISPSVGAALAAKYGQSAETFFNGKHILVAGEAKRVTIWFYANGLRTNKYYYQTHIVLTDANQVDVVGAPQS